MRGKDWDAERANTEMIIDDIEACNKAQDVNSYQIHKILGHTSTWDDVASAFVSGFANGCSWTRVNVSKALRDWLQEFGRE